MYLAESVCEAQAGLRRRRLRDGIADSKNAGFGRCCNASWLLNYSYTDALALAGPCKDIPDRGGFACCRDESCVTQTPGPPRKYFFEYNITFRRVQAMLTALNGRIEFLINSEL